MRRLILLAGGVGAVLMGIGILVAAGLPQRAAYTGYFIPGVALPIAPEVGALAPPIQHVNLSGESVSLWDLRGAPILINFWATWCAPCIAEMPDLQAIYEEYADSGLRILAVNLNESHAEIRTWVEQLGLTFDILPDLTGGILRDYPRHGPPATYLIAPDGVIIRIDYGPIQADTLGSQINQLLVEGR